MVRTNLPVCLCLLLTLLVGCESPTSPSTQLVQAQLSSSSQTEFVSAEAAGLRAVRPALESSHELAPQSSQPIDFMPEIVLGWGDGVDEVGLLIPPPSAEGRPSGPQSLAIGHDGTLWLLDPVNRRLIHLTANGKWLGTLPCPPGAIDLAVDPRGQPAVISHVNQRVFFVDPQQTEPLLGSSADWNRAGIWREFPLPPSIRHISGVKITPDDHFLLMTAYQQTFDLGRFDARNEWPNLLYTRREGYTSSSGLFYQFMLDAGQAVALLYGSDKELPERLWLVDTTDVASIVVLDVTRRREIIALLEWFEDDSVRRSLRLYDARGEVQDQFDIGSSPLYPPFREFVVRGGDVLHMIAHEDGLTIHTIRLGGAL